MSSPVVEPPTPPSIWIPLFQSWGAVLAIVVGLATVGVALAGKNPWIEEHRVPLVIGSLVLAVVVNAGATIVIVRRQDRAWRDHDQKWSGLVEVALADRDEQGALAARIGADMLHSEQELIAARARCVELAAEKDMLVGRVKELEGQHARAATLQDQRVDAVKSAALLALAEYRRHVGGGFIDREWNDRWCELFAIFGLYLRGEALNSFTNALTILGKAWVGGEGVPVAGVIRDMFVKLRPGDVRTDFDPSHVNWLDPSPPGS